MIKTKKKNWKVLIISLIVVYLTAFLGSIFTTKNTGSAWYESIRVSITPPNWIFPVVWNVLFFLIALSLYFAWIAGDKNEKKKIALVFAINLALNVIWSVIFFGYKLTQLAFFELILLWISILAMILITRKISKKAAWLLVPYLVWVSFAGVLNWLIAFG